MSDEARRAAIERNKENKARLAFASATFEIDGGGYAEFEDAAEFGLAFLERPYVMTGISIDLELADLPDGTPPPMVTGYVVEWDQNEHGFYTGAYCAAHVDWGVTVPPEGFTFEIDFTFRGIAMKDVDPEVRA